MKLIVVLIGIAALAVAGVFGLRFLNKAAMPKDGDKSGEGTKKGEKTAQDIMPFADIKGSVMVQRDGTAIAYVKVKCNNNSLLNKRELVRETEKTATALASASLWSMKIIRIQRPIDSTKNIATLHAERQRCVSAITAAAGDDYSSRTKREYSLARIRTIDSMIDSLKASQSKGGVQKTECYIALPVELAPANERIAHNRAVDMRAALRNAGIEAEVLDGQGIMRLIMSYMGDNRTAAQNTNPYRSLPIVRGLYAEKKEGEDDAIPA